MLDNPPWASYTSRVSREEPIDVRGAHNPALTAAFMH
jgi:hypothetical protein